MIGSSNYINLIELKYYFKFNEKLGPFVWAPKVVRAQYVLILSVLIVGL